MSVARYKQLHDEIVADPDDDRLRLEFADLVEPNDPERAEFIRLQLARSKEEREQQARFSGPISRLSGSREEALLRRRGADWARYIAMFTLDRPFGKPGYDFHRGFVSYIHADADLFLEQGDRMLRLAPVQHIDFKRGDASVEALLACPLIARLASIGLNGWGLDDNDMETIAACPNLERCRSLDLGRNRIRWEGVERLAASATIRNIVFVSLGGNPINYGNRRSPLPTKYLDEHGRWHWDDLPAESVALEEKYGFVPWIHPANIADRYQAYWLSKDGVLPRREAPSRDRSDASASFALLGDDDDETRLLVDQRCGFSIPIPGHPRTKPTLPEDRPRYDVLVRLEDVELELGFRLDMLPADSDPESLARSLVKAYAANRAVTDVPRVLTVRGEPRGDGVEGAAMATYPVADDGHMEQLKIAVKRHDGGMWAMIMTARFAKRDLHPLRWANIRATFVHEIHWHPEAPRVEPPKLWPEQSKYAVPGAAMRLQPEQELEAQNKARDLPSLSSDAVANLVERLKSFGLGDDRPTRPVHPMILDMLRKQLKMSAPSDEVAEILLRNVDGIETTHDLRAWSWQCIWAIGNRANQS